MAIDLSSLGLKDQGLPALPARASGLPARSAILATALPLGAALLLFACSDGRFRANGVQVLGALTLGLLVAAGCYTSAGASAMASTPTRWSSRCCGPTSRCT